MTQLSKVLILSMLLFCCAGQSMAAMQTITSGEDVLWEGDKTKLNANFGELYARYGSDCTVWPCYNGAAGQGSYIRLRGASGFYQELLAGNSAANRSWKLPIAAPPISGTKLLNVDPAGQMALVDPATFEPADATLLKVSEIDTPGEFASVFPNLDFAPASSYEPADATLLKIAEIDTPEEFASVFPNLNFTSAPDTETHEEYYAALPGEDVAAKIESIPIAPSMIEMPQNAAGSQLIELMGATGAGKVGLIAPANVDNDFYIRSPTSGNPGQTLTLGTPTSVLGPDGILRTPVYPLEPVDGVSIGSSAPQYKDSPHPTTFSIGGAIGARKLYIYDPETAQHYKVADLGDVLPASAPEMLSWTIIGSGPEQIKMTYGDAVTYTTSVEDLCDGFTITLRDANLLTIGNYISGNNTTEVTCALTTPVYQGDPPEAATYTPGLIKGVVSDTLLTAQSNFLLNTYNASTEPAPVTGCGASTTLVNETFSGDLTTLQQKGVWSINGGTTRQTTYNSGWIYRLLSNATVTADCQWASLEMDGPTSDTTTGIMGVALREASNIGYGARIYNLNNVSTLQWIVYNNDTVIETIYSAAFGTNVTDADVFFFRVSGTGADGTTLEVWRNPSGATPSASGTPTYTIQRHIINPVNTAGKLGILSKDWVSSTVGYTALRGGN